MSNQPGQHTHDGIESSMSRLALIEALVATVGIAGAVAAAFLLSFAGVPFWITVSVSAVAWLLAGHAGVFKVAISMSDVQVVSTVAVSALAGFVAVAFGEAVLRQAVHPAIDYLAASLTAFASTAAGVNLGRHVVRALWRAGRLRTSTVVVGFDYMTHELSLELNEHPSLGMDVVGHVDLREDSPSWASDMAAVVSASNPDRIIIGGPSTKCDYELAQSLDAGQARVYVMPQLLEAQSTMSPFAPHQLNGFPLLRVDRKLGVERQRASASARHPGSTLVSR